jgi:hypothetical protein
MSQDLRSLLSSWPYHPQKTARITKGDDGRDILQVRLPLGLEPYEMTGRPDGQKPYGQDSIFDFPSSTNTRSKRTTGCIWRNGALTSCG